MDGALSGVEGPKRAGFFPQEELNYQVLHELTPMFSEWAGVPLEPTSVYGVRIYRDGSTLRDHLDVLESHVISGILHIDSDLDEPFPIQIEGSDGKLASVDLKPGLRVGKVFPPEKHSNERPVLREYLHALSSDRLESHKG